MNSLKKMTIVFALLSALLLAGCDRDKNKQKDSTDTASSAEVSAESANENDDIPDIEIPTEKRVIKSMKVYDNGELVHSDERDEQGRPLTSTVHLIYAEGRNVCTSVYEYDGDNLSMVTNSYEYGERSVTTFEYDDKGRTTKELNISDNAQIITLTVTEYEGEHSRKETYYYSGYDKPYDEDISPADDTVMMPSEIDVNKLTTTNSRELTYDDQDRLIAVKDTDDYTDSVIESTIEYSKYAYEGGNIVQRVTTRKNGKIDTIDHYTYNEYMDPIIIKHYTRANYKRGTDDVLLLEGEKLALQSETTYEYEYY